MAEALFTGKAGRALTAVAPIAIGATLTRGTGGGAETLTVGADAIFAAGTTAAATSVWPAAEAITVWAAHALASVTLKPGVALAA